MTHDLVRRSDTGELVVLKVYHRGGPPADVRRHDEMLANLHHPNSLRVVTIGECEGRAYTVLEYVAKDLAAVLRE